MRDALPGGGESGGSDAGGDVAAAEAALAEVGADGDGAAVRWLLCQATGDRAHLEEAKRRLEESIGSVSAEYHEAMLANLRVNREIMAAWAEHDDVGAGD